MWRVGKVYQKSLEQVKLSSRIEILENFSCIVNLDLKVDYP